MTGTCNKVWKICEFMLGHEFKGVSDIADNELKNVDLHRDEEHDWIAMMLQSFPQDKMGA